MKPLFSFAPDVIALRELIDETDGELSGVTDAPDRPTPEQIVDQWLDEHLGDKSQLAVKLDGYAWLIQECDAREDALRKAAAKLLSQARTAANQSAFLRGRLEEFYRTTGLTSVITASGQTVRRQKNGGAVPLVLSAGVLSNPAGHLPPTLVRERTEVSPDRDAIRAALAAGQVIEGCSLGQPTFGIRIA